MSSPQSLKKKGYLVNNARAFFLKIENFVFEIKIIRICNFA